MAVEFRSDLFERIIAYLKENGGRGKAVEIVSVVMGLDNCSDGLARSIVLNGLAGDRRIRLEPSGDLVLREDKEEDPLVSRLQYAVIDVETTGLAAPSNRIIELAAIMVSKGEITGEFSTLLNPGTAVPKTISGMTGITGEMLDGAPRFEDMAPALLQELGDRVLVAHNSPFDLNFLNSELHRAMGIGLGNRSLCTVRLARKLIGGLDSYSLDSLARYFDIEIADRHRALGDAAATALIFLRLCGLAREKGWNRWSDLKFAAGRS